MENFWLNKDNCNMEEVEKIYNIILNFLKDITTQENDTILLNKIRNNIYDTEDVYNKLTELIDKEKINIFDYHVTETAYLTLKSLKISK
ncbi:MAG: hypothetical protein WC915_06775 [archaeon]|jgi:hypothetical protein